MKILHICTGFPLSYQGGITNYVRSLAAKQQKKGFDVYVLAGQDETNYDFHYITYQSKRLNIRTLGKLQDKEGLEFIERLVETEQFDIIHIHMMIVDWDLCGLLSNYKYVVSLHDYFYLCPRIFMLSPGGRLCQKFDGEQCKKCISRVEQVPFFRKMYSFLRKITTKESIRPPFIPQDITGIRYERFKELLENAEYALPVSNRVMEIYKDSGIQANYKVLHIGNVTADHFSPYNPSNRIKKKDEKIRLAMLGALTSYKGFELFIKLAKNVDRSKVEFHFWGRIVAQNGELLLREADIQYHGPYQQKDLPKILKSIDVGLVLSIWEDNGPQVVMEFLNNHIPVIGTQMGGIMDFITGDNGYLFNPYKEDQIAGTIQFINHLNRDKIDMMIRHIKRTTTTEEHFQNLSEVYADILGMR